MGCGELTSPPSWGGHEVTTHSPWNAEGPRVYHTPQVCTHRHTRPDTHTQTCTHTNTCTHVHAHHTQQAGAAHMRTHGHTGWHRHGHTHLLQGAQRWPGGGSAVPGPAALVPGGEQVREDSGRGEEG